MNADSLEDMFMNASSYVNRNEVSSFLKIRTDESLYKQFFMPTDMPLLDAMMLVDYKSFMVDDVLTKVDRATMSVSLEGREPFLDHRIIEFMARVPVDLKYKNRQGKYLARQILYKYVPQEMIDKPKAGFQIPLAEWLQSDLKPLVEKYLDTSRLDEEIFDVSEVEQLLKLFFDGDASHANTIWFILIFQMWKEKWL